MPMSADSRCPGSGMNMVPRTYLIRKIEPADRQDNAVQIAEAYERGDPEWAEMVQRAFDDWERNQGQTEERLVCAVCGDALLKPTARGTARPHARRDIQRPTWDRVRQLRQDIKTLEIELDRVIQALEPSQPD